MSKQVKSVNEIKFRNFWPQGTSGGTTQVKGSKKGKTSYNRNKAKREGRSSYYGNDLHSCS